MFFFFVLYVSRPKLPFRFIEALDSKGTLTWKGITSAMDCADHDTLLRDKKDRVYFARSEGNLVYLQFCEYFLRVWALEVKFYSLFIKRVRRFEGK